MLYRESLDPLLRKRKVFLPRKSYSGTGVSDCRRCMDIEEAAREYFDLWNTLRNKQRKQGWISRWLESRRLNRDDMETMQCHFKQVHKITEAQDPMDIECMRYGHIPRDAKTILAKESEVEIRCVHDLPNETAMLYLYAARKDDDICKVAWGQIKSGGQLTERGFYIDSIDLVHKWLSPVRCVNVLNGIARIKLQTHGYHRLFVRIDGKGTWYVDMAGMC